MCPADIDAATLGCAAFNASPRRINLSGVRERHGELFGSLGGVCSGSARGGLFREYMERAFGVPALVDGRPQGYLRYLMGWMADSNSAEGAVLKAWVESRFGLPPTFHRDRLGGPECRFRALYLADLDRMRTGSGVFEQFDLIYEYVQEELARLLPGVTHLTLYRGVTSLNEYTLANSKEAVLALKMNNLNSFTREFERAWEFGERVMEVAVPLCKVFFDETALATGVLRGEEELIVIGGTYEVRLRWY